MHCKISRERLSILNNGRHASGYINTKDKYNNQCDRHNDALDKICGGCGKESAQCCIADDDQCTDDHGNLIIDPEHAGKKLSAGGKTGSGIRDKKDYDENSTDRLENFFLITVAVAEKGWKGNRISCYMSIAADSFCYDPPVQISTDGKSDGCPAGIGNSGQISKSRKSHQKPTAHVRSFGTHGGNKRT